MSDTFGYWILVGGSAFGALLCLMLGFWLLAGKYRQGGWKIWVLALMLFGFSGFLGCYAYGVYAINQFFTNLSRTYEIQQEPVDSTEKTSPAREK